jgi:hypothetical protein
MATRVVFGKTSFLRGYCWSCRSEAFIIDGLLSCCDLPFRENEVQRTIYVTQKAIKRKAISKKLRLQLIEEQNNRCFYCGCDLAGYYLRDDVVRKIRIHVDHVQPFSAVGDSTEMVAACNVCNLIKSNKVFGNMEELVGYILEQRDKKGIGILNG